MGDAVERVRRLAKAKGPLALVRRLLFEGLWRIAPSSFAPILVDRYAKAAKDARTIEQSLDFALSYESMGVSIAPLQIREEIDGLMKVVSDLRPHTVLEIGTASGGTLFLFTRVVAEDAEVISVDLPEGEFGGGYPAWKSRLFKSFALNGQSIQLLRADSHKPETLKAVREVLQDRPVDFLFIDGDHSYEGVRKDFEMYSPLVRNGGIIAFHDVCPGPAENVGGVPDFWREVSVKRGGMDIIKDRNQGGFGIGVLNL